MNTFKVMLWVCIAMIWGGCSSQESTEEDGVAIDSVAVVEADTLVTAVVEDTLVPINTPMLDTVMATKKDVKTIVEEYKEMLASPHEIIDDQGVLKVLAKRDDVINAIQYEVLEALFYEKIPSMENSSVVEEQVIGELEQLGFSPIYAEGMYIGLADAPILANQIEKVGSEPLKIYLKFKEAYAASLGSEYTYMDLVPEMQMVAHAEELLAKFPDSEYAQRITGNYEEAILALTDIHMVGDHQQLVLYGVSDDVYPNGTDLTNFDTFEKQYSNLKLWEVASKIKDNMSVLDPELSDTLYIVSVQEFTEPNTARSASLVALKAGHDIPHVLPISTEEGKKHLLAYRFYSTAEQATAALPKAQEMKPKAKLLKAKYDKGALSLIELVK